MSNHFNHWVKHCSIINYGIELLGVFGQQIFIFDQPEEFVIEGFWLRRFPSKIFSVSISFKQLVRNVCRWPNVKIVCSHVIAVDKPVIFLLEKIIKKLEHFGSNQAVIHVQQKVNFVFFTVFLRNDVKVFQS